MMEQRSTTSSEQQSQTGERSERTDQMRTQQQSQSESQQTLQVSREDAVNASQAIRRNLREAKEVFSTENAKQSYEKLFQATVLLRREIGVNSALFQPAAQTRPIDRPISLDPDQIDVDRSDNLQRDSVRDQRERVGENLTRPGETNAAGEPIRPNTPGWSVAEGDRSDGAHDEPGHDNAREENIAAMDPDERELREQIRNLEEFSLRLSEGEVESAEEFNDVYDDLYKSLVAYNYHLAANVANRGGITARDWGFEGNERTLPATGQNQRSDQQQPIAGASEQQNRQTAADMNRQPQDRQIAGSPDQPADPQNRQVRPGESVGNRQIQALRQQREPGHFAKETIAYVKDWAEVTDNELNEEARQVLREVEQLLQTAQGSSGQEYRQAMARLGGELDDLGFNVDADAVQARADIDTE